MKKCIMHLPWKLSEYSVSASEIRPLKIKQAFESCGYCVYFIMGDSLERKQQIRKLKERLKNHEIFDFMYSESSTLPMMLTDTDHLPRRPFVDLSLFNLCKNHKIPIGLFYRDIHWAYPVLKRFNIFKHTFSKIFHLIDIIIYNLYLDYFYLPFNNSKLVYDKIPLLSNKIRISDLMPGCDEVDAKNQKDDYYLYIGGIKPDLYDLSTVFEAFSVVRDKKLIVCVPEKQWELYKEYYKDNISDNIEVVHYVNKQAQELIKHAKYGLNYFGDNEYRNIAVPLKVFEYITWNTPIISQPHDYTGVMIKKNTLGFTIEYSSKSLQQLLKNPPSDSEYFETLDSIIRYKSDNMWLNRAKKVISDLKPKMEN